jgi:hypothetical protein
MTKGAKMMKRNETDILKGGNYPSSDIYRPEMMTDKFLLGERDFADLVVLALGTTGDAKFLNVLVTKNQVYRDDYIWIIVSSVLFKPDARGKYNFDLAMSPEIHQDFFDYLGEHAAPTAPADDSISSEERLVFLDRFQGWLFSLLSKRRFRTDRNVDLTKFYPLIHCLSVEEIFGSKWYALACKYSGTRTAAQVIGMCMLHPKHAKDVVHFIDSPTLPYRIPRENWKLIIYYALPENVARDKLENIISFFFLDGRPYNATTEDFKFFIPKLALVKGLPTYIATQVISYTAHHTTGSFWFSNALKNFPNPTYDTFEMIYNLVMSLQDWDKFEALVMFPGFPVSILNEGFLTWMLRGKFTEAPRGSKRVLVRLASREGISAEVAEMLVQIGDGDITNALIHNASVPGLLSLFKDDTPFEEIEKFNDYGQLVNKFPYLGKVAERFFSYGTLAQKAGIVFDLGLPEDKLTELFTAADAEVKALSAFSCGGNRDILASKVNHLRMTLFDVLKGMALRDYPESFCETLWAKFPWLRGHLMNMPWCPYELVARYFNFDIAKTDEYYGGLTDIRYSYFKNMPIEFTKEFYKIRVGLPEVLYKRGMWSGGPKRAFLCLIAAFRSGYYHLIDYYDYLDPVDVTHWGEAADVIMRKWGVSDVAFNGEKILNHYLPISWYMKEAYQKWIQGNINHIFDTRLIERPDLDHVSILSPIFARLFNEYQIIKGNKIKWFAHKILRRQDVVSDVLTVALTMHALYLLLFRCISRKDALREGESRNFVLPLWRHDVFISVPEKGVYVSEGGDKGRYWASDVYIDRIVDRETGEEVGRCADMADTALIYESKTKFHSPEFYITYYAPNSEGILLKRLPSETAPTTTSAPPR